MQEIWKDIPNFEGLYKISNIGNIASNIKISGKSKILKQSRSSTGYFHVQLYKDGKAYTCNVHRLVASAFIPSIEGKPQINHKDGNKANNSVDNLEWVSASENQIHSINNGLRSKSPMTDRKGKDNPNSKTILQYTINGSFVQEWASIADIARNFHCNASSISACVNGRNKTAKGYMWIAKTENTIPEVIAPVIYEPRKFTKYGYHQNKKRKPGIVNAKTIPVYQFSLSGEFIKKWQSVSEVSRFLKCTRYKVNKCCQGSIQSLNNFIWCYESSYET